MSRFIKYHTEYVVDGEARTIEYYRSVWPEDAPEADAKNQEVAEEIASYNAACALGAAEQVVTTSELVDA